MLTFDISFMRVDRDAEPTVVESFVRTVDWPLLPREGEGLDIGADMPATVESVGYDIDGYPMSSWAASCSTTSRSPSFAGSSGA